MTDLFLTYSIVGTNPALPYNSESSTIRLYPITTGKDAGFTYITWTGTFSPDAGDGKFFTTNPLSVDLLMISPRSPRRSQSQAPRCPYQYGRMGNTSYKQTSLNRVRVLQNGLTQTDVLV
jgi:hypothetical protein